MPELNLGGGPADAFAYDPDLDDFGEYRGAHQVEVGSDGRILDDRDLIHALQERHKDDPSFMPYGNRNLLLDSYLLLERMARKEPPTDLVIVRSVNGEDSVFNCPITGVPLTWKMAKGVGIQIDDLDDIVHRRSPLGISTLDWNTRVGELFTAFERAGIHDLQVAIGGNAVGVFSSLATAIEKKQFPHTKARLRHLFELKQQADPASGGGDVMGFVKTAWKFVLETTEGMQRLPRSPWWGSMEKLGLEVQDIDLQLYSPTFNARLEADDVAQINRSMDIWGRWTQRDIRRLFPSIGKVMNDFDAQKIDLEFLPDPVKMQKRIKEGEWWSIPRPGLSVLLTGPGQRRRRT